MVNVTNDLPNEGTTLHWHGLRQPGTPWYDGVPACRFVWDFLVSQYVLPIRGMHRLDY
jgi:FtsP/CotA-like multicopper oxidase with cupredoxin domain